MSGLELLQKHPLVANVIKDWFHQLMIESFKDPEIAEEFKEFVLEQGIENDKLGILIISNPRMLFDVFDENKLYIHIVPISPIKGEMKFLIGIDTLESLDDTPSTQYSTRKEAELYAIGAAFEILENKLSPKVEE